jgi:DNA polymerase-1
VYDEARVLARFGVRPAQLPAYVALVGDASDNLPGVPGIGPSTARKLLIDKKSCSELLSTPETLKPERARHTLLLHREQILHTEHLARLRDDLELPNLGALWKAPDPNSLQALRALFEQLEFRSLLARLDVLISS